MPLIIEVDFQKFSLGKSQKDPESYSSNRRDRARKVRLGGLMEVGYVLQLGHFTGVSHPD